MAVRVFDQLNLGPEGSIALVALPHRLTMNLHLVTVQTFAHFATHVALFQVFPISSVRQIDVAMQVGLGVVLFAAIGAELISRFMRRIEVIPQLSDGYERFPALLADKVSSRAKMKERFQSRQTGDLRVITYCTSRRCFFSIISFK